MRGRPMRGWLRVLPSISAPSGSSRSGCTRGRRTRALCPRSEGDRRLERSPSLAVLSLDWLRQNTRLRPGSAHRTGFCGVEQRARTCRYARLAALICRRSVRAFPGRRSADRRDPNGVGPVLRVESAAQRTYSSLWPAMLITLPSGARTKNLRSPHASSVSG
jgi:hypothetical protein